MQQIYDTNECILENFRVIVYFEDAFFIECDLLLIWISAYYFGIYFDEIKFIDYAIIENFNLLFQNSLQSFIRLN